MAFSLAASMALAQWRSDRSGEDSWKCLKACPSSLREPGIEGVLVHKNRRQPVNRTGVYGFDVRRLRRRMVLRIAFSVLGFAALTIGGLMFVIGPAATGQLFATMLRVVMPSAPALVGLSGADIDSEMRFYAVLWMAYGGVALWVARTLPTRVNLLRLMLVIFWFGGVGRVISYLAVGAPHPLFIVLMWIEIALAPVLIAMSYAGAEASSTD